MTGRCMRTARRSTASSAARPTARPSWPASSSWGPIRDSSSPGRGAGPRRPLGRGRGPAGTLRPDRSAQPGAGPGLGHRLPEGGRPRRLPRGLRGVHGQPGPDPTVVWNALSAASLFALGAEGLDDYRVPIAWFERRLSAVPVPPPVFRHLASRTHWAGCCSGPAGSTRRSPA